MNRVTELLKLSPVAVLAMLMFMGYDALIAAPIATIYAALVAGFVERKKVNEPQEQVGEHLQLAHRYFYGLIILWVEMWL